MEYVEWEIILCIFFESLNGLFVVFPLHPEMPAMGIATLIAYILDWEARWSGSWLLNSMVAKPKKGYGGSRGRGRRKGGARAASEAEGRG